MKPTPTRRGFTLIELLVIVAIIAILVAVLLPVFSGTHCGRPSHRATCQSNLKQIGLGLMQYCQDYNDRLPRLVNGFSAEANTNYLSWRRVVDPYVKSQTIYQCSSPYKDRTEPHPDPYDGFPMSYDVVDCGPIKANRSMPLDYLDAPAQTIIVFEENDDNPESQQIGVPWDHDNGAPNWTNILFAGHLGTGNYLFADGHVKSISPLKTVANGVNMWHLNPRDPVTPRVWEKLDAAEKTFNGGTF